MPIRCYFADYLFHNVHKNSNKCNEILVWEQQWEGMGINDGFGKGMGMNHWEQEGVHGLKKTFPLILTWESKRDHFDCKAVAATTPQLADGVLIKTRVFFWNGTDLSSLLSSYGERSHYRKWPNLFFVIVLETVHSWQQNTKLRCFKFMHTLRQKRNQKNARCRLIIGLQNVLINCGQVETWPVDCGVQDSEPQKAEVTVATRDETCRASSIHRESANGNNESNVDTKEHASDPTRPPLVSYYDELCNSLCTVI